MSSTIREQILEYIAGTGAAGGPLTGGVVAVAGVTAVYRSRQAAVERSEGIVVLVQSKDEKVENRNTGLAIRDFSPEVILILRSDTPEQDADPIIALIQAALFADQTLGGLASRIIEEGTEWTFAEADTVAAEVSMTYRIRYLTPTTTLTALA